MRKVYENSDFRHSFTGEGHNFDVQDYEQTRKDGHNLFSPTRVGFQEVTLGKFTKIMP